MMQNDDTLMKRMSAFYEAFLVASYEKRWKLAEQALADEPELFDRETVFEVGNGLFDQAVAAGDIARFDRLLDQIEKAAPEAYENELHYMLEWRTQIALLRGDDGSLATYFYQFSPLAGTAIDTYYQIVSMLSYFGKQEILYTGMRQAWPYVEESDELVDWAYGEFTEKLGALELMQLLDADPDLTADNPTLQERFAEYNLTIVPGHFAAILDYRTGRKEPSWTLEEIQVQVEEEKTAENRNFDFLLAAFMRYAHMEEGWPRPKVEMGRDNLVNYLIQREAGQLGRIGRSKRKSKRRKKGKRRAQPHPLCPDSRTLKKGLDQFTGFLSVKPYEAASLFEIVPVWLRFLVTLDLLDERGMKNCLTKIGSLKGQFLPFVQDFTSMPAVEENLRTWPEKRHIGE